MRGQEYHAFEVTFRRDEPRSWIKWTNSLDRGLEVLISARMGFEPFDGELDPGLLSNAGERLGRRDKHFVPKVVLIKPLAT